MAIVVEIFVALAVALGAYTRLLVLRSALYILGTALIGHHFWTMEGASRYGSATTSTNISIIGGLLLLYITGAGKYSVDAGLGSCNGGVDKLLQVGVGLTPADLVPHEDAAGLSRSVERGESDGPLLISYGTRIESRWPDLAHTR